MARESPWRLAGLSWLLRSTEMDARPLLSARGGGVLAVGPGAAQVLVRGRLERAAAGAAVPADDLARLAALLAAPFPARGPRGVGRHGTAALLVPEQRLARA